MDWSGWGSCSQTCGNGTQLRTRECDGPYYGGANCSGAWTDETVCTAIPCPGRWGDRLTVCTFALLLRISVICILSFLCNTLKMLYKFRIKTYMKKIRKSLISNITIIIYTFSSVIFLLFSFCTCMCHYIILF